MTRLSGVRACVFDAYGTLFDFASAAARCPGIPEEKRAALTSLWRDKQLNIPGCEPCRVVMPISGR